MTTESTIDPFDRTIGKLDGTPGVDKSKAVTIVDTTIIVGSAQTYIVQTYRQNAEQDDKGDGDYIFIQHIAQGSSYRIVLTPKVADVIARQRDALTTKGRRRRGKAAAEARQAAGYANPLLDPAVRAKARTARLAKRRKNTRQKK